MERVDQAERSASGVSPPVKAPSRLISRRRRSSGSFYAIKASEDEITLPRIERLGILEQRRLFLRAQAGDTAARQILWLANARLAYSVVNRYHRARAQDAADAIQVGIVGISRAIDKFEPQRLNEFSTYAYHWVRQAVDRNRTLTAFFTRIPPHLFSDYIAFRRNLQNAVSRSAEHQVHLGECKRNLALYFSLLRIHRLAEPAPLSDAASLEDPAASPLDRIIRHETSNLLRQAMQALDDRERIILQLRYGLNDQPELTLEQVGHKFKLTRERIRQVQQHAEARLRSILNKLAPELTQPPERGPIPSRARKGAQTRAPQRKPAPAMARTSQRNVHAGTLKARRRTFTDNKPSEAAPRANPASVSTASDPPRQAITTVHNMAETSSLETWSSHQLAQALASDPLFGPDDNRSHEVRIKQALLRMQTSQALARLQSRRRRRSVRNPGQLALFDQSKPPPRNDSSPLQANPAPPAAPPTPQQPTAPPSPEPPSFLSAPPIQLHLFNQDSRP